MIFLPNLRSPSIIGTLFLLSESVEELVAVTARRQARRFYTSASSRGFSAKVRFDKGCQGIHKKLTWNIMNLLPTTWFAIKVRRMVSFLVFRGANTVHVTQCLDIIVASVGRLLLM